MSDLSPAQQQALEAAQRLHYSLEGCDAEYVQDDAKRERALFLAGYELRRKEDAAICRKIGDERRHSEHMASCEICARAIEGKTHG